MKKLNPYKLTKVDYVKSQTKINQYLNYHDIYDIQHSIYEGKATLTFVKKVKVENKEFKIGIRMTLPNINEKTRNQKYRILFHYLKSKFEAVDFGLLEEENQAFVKEFLPYVIADSQGKTVADLIMPQLEKNALTTKENEQLYLDKPKDDSIHKTYIQEEKNELNAIDAEYSIEGEKP